MSSSSIIRQLDLQPVAVVVRRRSFPRPAEAAAKPTNLLLEAQRTRDEAERLLEQAQQESAEILAQARREGEQMKDSARAQGWQQGYRDGQLEAEASCAESVRVLAELAARARLDGDALLEEAESQVVGLALAIARKVVERELAVDPTTVLPMVQAALREIAEATAVRVRVHPDSLAVLAGRLEHDVELVGDPELRPGDCVVDTHNSLVDGRVEAKLGQVAEALRDVGRRKGRAG